jgi:phage N-6-adenine-methyltransferase
MKNRNLEHSDNWATPKNVYEILNNEFHFDFDPCPLNHDLSKWDGLKIEWKKRNFINPPYSRKLKEAFVLKAIEESKKGKLCVMLLPVSTSTKLFHDYILPNAKEIRFSKGRIKFLGINTKGEYVTNKAPMHDSMIIVFEGAKSSKMPKLKKWIIPIVGSSLPPEGKRAASYS